MNRWALIYIASACSCALCQATDLPQMRLIGGEGAPLWVSETPVTFAQWSVCVAQGGCSGYRPDRQGWAAQAPVVNVGYADAQRYLRWLSARTQRVHRLPRENEWARLVGASSTWIWGEDEPKGRTNCLDCGSRWDGRKASPVRAFPANGHGLYDLVGNVAHWTQLSASGASLCGNKPGYAVIRGASWAEPVRYLKTEEWACFPKVLRDDTIGFRVVSDAPPRVSASRESPRKR